MVAELVQARDRDAAETAVLTSMTAVARDAGGASPPGLWQEQRAALELLELLASPVYYGVGVPRGDAAPVLVVPGFLGSDDYLVLLRGWLRRIGYRPHASQLLCVGPVERLLARLLHRVETVAAAAERPLVLVGHSLGGMLSCGVAQRRPDLVEQVVTLGTGRAAEMDEDAGDPLVRALAERLLGSGAPLRDRLAAQGLIGCALPAGVRLSCIYSRDDAVVHWRACLDADPGTAMCQVRGTHGGLAWNAQVYRHLGRLLAQG